MHRTLKRTRVDDIYCLERLLRRTAGSPCMMNYSAASWLLHGSTGRDLILDASCRNDGVGVGDLNIGDGKHLAYDIPEWSTNSDKHCIGYD